MGVKPLNTQPLQVHRFIIVPELKKLINTNTKILNRPMGTCVVSTETNLGLVR